MNKAFKYRIYPRTEQAILIGCGRFVYNRMLANRKEISEPYKLTVQGKQLIVIDKWVPSSKQCRFCQHKNTTVTLADRVWMCPDCGAALDRDENAAINIKNRGYRMLGIA